MARTFLSRRASLQKSLMLVAIVGCLFQGMVWGQRQIKRHKRVTPPEFKAGQFDGVFFEDALAQLQGDRPTVANATNVMTTPRPQGESSAAIAAEASAQPGAGDSIWKSTISGESIEDLISMPNAYSPELPPIAKSGHCRSSMKPKKGFKRFRTS